MRRKIERPTIQKIQKFLAKINMKLSSNIGSLSTIIFENFCFPKSYPHFEDCFGSKIYH